MIAVDLDGTLLTCNSLHAYMRAGLKCLAKQGRIAALAKAAALMLARALRIASHRSLKFGMAKIIGWDGAVMAAFKKEIDGKLSQPVQTLIQAHTSQGAIAVLATAAFDFYIPTITSLPFIATPLSGNPQRHENRGEAKARALSQWLEANGCRLEAVVTDDAKDDAPLLALPARRKYLVKNGTILLLD